MREIWGDGGEFHLFEGPRDVSCTLGKGPARVVGSDQASKMGGALFCVRGFPGAFIYPRYRYRPHQLLQLQGV